MSAHISSQQVSWFDVHMFVAPWLEAVGDFPTAGTAAWLSLPDDHPKKWAAVLAAASPHILRMEVAQIAECEASSAISSGADWGDVARSHRRHADAVASGAYIPRRVVA